MSAYYNEIDPYAAQWLRNLIAAGHIAPGDVDERDIRDIRPEEIQRYTQCHFFAGIGVWSYALRRAGWPDERPVWTGSPPCQPFSAAGRRGGEADERHLWPHLYHLIGECRPPQFFGEQVASKDGLAWLDLVQADMEAAHYSGGAFDLCAAGFGAPHIRQRQFLCFSKRVADDFRQRRDRRKNAERPTSKVSSERNKSANHSERYGEFERLADTLRKRAAWQSEFEKGSSEKRPDTNRIVPPTTTKSCAPDLRGKFGKICPPSVTQKRIQPGPTNGPWENADWLLCRDATWRAVESGTFPLAHGVAARVGRLRAYGNAIVTEVAVALIKSFLETEN